MDPEIEEFLNKEKRIIIEGFLVKADNYLSDPYRENIFDHFHMIDIGNERRIRFNVKFDYVNRDYILPGNLFTGFDWIDILVIEGVYQEILTMNFLKGLTNLVNLSFRNSGIKQLEPGFFSFTPKLRSLVLSYLGLFTLPPDFLDLKHLNDVSLKETFEINSDFNRLKNFYMNQEIKELKKSVKEIYNYSKRTFVV